MPKKISKANKGHKGQIKGQIHKSITFLEFFSLFWNHWDLIDWKMTLVKIPRLERPLKGQLIAESETCRVGCQLI